MDAPRQPEIHVARVDVAGLLRVLGSSLYSTPVVAVRELAQNAHDSCTRRRLEDPACDEASLRVIVRPDSEAGVLEFIDFGAGMTDEEIVRYLATIGSGYTGELRTRTQDPSLIGAYGLGFLSALFVSERVEVTTTSWTDPSRTWRFTTRGGERYHLGEHDEPRPVGTTVRITLAESHRDLADPATVTDVLEHHCALLPIPIHVGGAMTPPLNVSPPWREDSERLSVRERHEAMTAFVARFEDGPEPLAMIPLGAWGAELTSSIRGLLWIRQGQSHATTDLRHVRVHVRGMLVTDDERDLLPAWAGFCGAVIEADALTPTTSREDLQEDAAWHDAASRLKETLVEGLARLATRERPAWRRVLAHHEQALRGAAVSDPRLFDLLADDLRVPTSEGDLTVPEIRRRSEGRLLVATGDSGDHEALLFSALGIPVVDGTRFAAFSFCRLHAERSGAPLVQLGTRDGEKLIFTEASIDAGTRAFLEEAFARPGIGVVPSRFRPAHLPLVLVPDREAALKRLIESDEADRRLTAGALALARMHVARIDGELLARVFVNMDAPIIQAILDERVSRSRRVLAAGVLRSLTDVLARRVAVEMEIDVGAALASLGDDLVNLLRQGESA